MSRGGTGHRAPLELLQQLASGFSSKVKRKVRVLITSLDRVGIAEATLPEKVFTAGFGKAFATILDTPLGAEEAVVAVMEDFVEHIPRLAELESRLRDTASGALGGPPVPRGRVEAAGSGTAELGGRSRGRGCWESARGWDHEEVGSERWLTVHGPKKKSSGQGGLARWWTCQGLPMSLVSVAP